MIQKRQFISFFIKRYIFLEHGITIMTTWTHHWYLKSTNNNNKNALKKLTTIVHEQKNRLFLRYRFCSDFKKTNLWFHVSYIGELHWAHSNGVAHSKAISRAVRLSKLHLLPLGGGISQMKMMHWFHLCDSNA